MKRWVVRGAMAFVALIVVTVGTITVLLRGSLPILDGEVRADGAALAAAVTIERDAGGVTTVRGADWGEMAYGLGFAHAQDRFFQMDLSRRLAAGELAALLGERLVEQDEKARLFRLRAVAREVIASASPTERAWIAAYTRGVNRGLETLQARPFEYFLLRQKPQPWREEDSVLVVHSMWWALQYSALESEIARLAIQARLLERRSLTSGATDSAPNPMSAVMQFLFPRGDEWDTPNFQRDADAAVANGGAPYTAPPIPSPDLIDLRASPSQTARNDHKTFSSSLDDREFTPGSNAWAVAGPKTASGGALVAGDMHLGLRVPAIWYRARLQVDQSDSPVSELNGVTLPGLPALVAGSNGYIAWSFTNSMGDWLDVQPLACQGRNYRSGQGGSGAFSVQREQIDVAGGSAVTLEILDSPQGVVVRRDPGESGAEDTCWVARWLVTEPGATTLTSMSLQQVTDVDAALALAPQVGIPHQNLTVGDRSGRIAWTIAGRIPQGTLGPQTPRPISWRTRAEAPTLIDPQVGRLWSANARHVEGELERVIGNDEAQGGMYYAAGVRTRQIRDGLLAIKTPATPADMLAIQLDHRSTLLDRWQRLLLATLDEDAVRNHPKRGELRRLATNWQGYASVDSVSFRIVRTFRDEVRKETWGMITRSLQAGEGSTAYPLFEGSLWRLVTEQPPHWLESGYADWRSFLLERIDKVIADLEAACGSLESCTWGLRNTAAVRHPLSPALGPLGRFLDMPPLQMDGDAHSPRVIGPNYGASERFAVSPGREAEGYMQLPGGQSGHPLSRFYREGFEDWAVGKPRPLLPGPAVHTLRLLPGETSSP